MTILNGSNGDPFWTRKMLRRKPKVVEQAEPTLSADQIDWNQIDWDDGPRCPCGDKAVVSRRPEGVSGFSGILIPMMPFCEAHRDVPLTTPWTRYANGRSWPCLFERGVWVEDLSAPWLS